MLRTLTLPVFLRLAGVQWASYFVGLVAAMATVVICINTMSERGGGITLYPTLGYGIRVIFIAAYLALVFAPMDYTIRKTVSRLVGPFSANVAGLAICLGVLAALMLGTKGVTEIAVLGTFCFVTGGIVGGLTRAVLLDALRAPTG